MAQTAHAVADFAVSSPGEFREWHANSNYIVVLTASHRAHLEELRSQAHTRGLACVSFHEPDMAEELTALAFIPHGSNKSFLSNLPLAGKKAGKLNKHTHSTK